jgi:hypothetical protein
MNIQIAFPGTAVNPIFKIKWFRSANRMLFILIKRTSRRHVAARGPARGQRWSSAGRNKNFRMILKKMDGRLDFL